MNRQLIEPTLTMVIGKDSSKAISEVLCNIPKYLIPDINKISDRIFRNRIRNLQYSDPELYITSDNDIVTMFRTKNNSYDQFVLKISFNRYKGDKREISSARYFGGSIRYWVNMLDYYILFELSDTYTALSANEPANESHIVRWIIDNYNKMN